MKTAILNIKKSKSKKSISLWEMLKWNKKLFSLRKVRIGFVVLFLTIFTVAAQEGINYKALIKDASGNVLANDLIQVQFSILQGVTQTNIYTESHSPTTDANGLIILTIGEGIIVSGDFTSIDWTSATHFLNVQVNTGSGLIDMGITQFMAVPYAKHAETAAIALIASNVTGLEALDEGDGLGWRLKGQDPNNYGNIAVNAVDLSYSSSASTIRGASGSNSTAMGRSTVASGNISTAMGNNTIASGNSSIATGSNTVASGSVSTAMGDNTTALGNYSTAIGYNTTASGGLSTAMGYNTAAEAYSSTAVGSYNIGGGDPANWIATDPLFEIGNGTGNSNRSNALTVYKNGSIAMNNSTASGSYSTAMGRDTYAPGYASTAMGNVAYALGNRSTAMGDNTKASGSYSTAMGRYSFASGNYSTTMGYFTSATGNYSTAMGRYNISGSNKLLMVGNGTSNSNASNAFTIYNGTDASLSSDTGYVMIGNNGSSNLVFDTNEIMARNNGSTSTLFLQNDGGALSVGGNIVHNSDRRLKKDIETLPYGLNEILQLQPKAYNWKNRDQNYKSLGLIAQEVQPIIKEIVTTQDNENKTLGISYTELIPILINAIKEQQDIIKSLQSTVSNQDKNYASLLYRITQLENRSNQ